MADNKATVRKIEEAWSKGDVAALDQYFAPEFVAHAAMPGTPQNLGSGKMAHGMVMKAFPDRTTTILDLIGEGDRVAARIRVQGTNTGGAPWFGAPEGNGKKIDFESWSLYRFKDGKVVESWGINDGVTAMVQLGGLKPPM